MPEEILEQSAVSAGNDPAQDAGSPKDETTPKPAAGEPNDPENESDEDAPRKMGGFQKRIAKLSTKLTTAQAEAEYWREQALRTSKPAATKVEAPVEAKEPQPEDFETVADYLKAVRQYDREALKRDLTGEIEKRDKQRTEASEKQTVEQRWSTKLSEARGKHDDFDEVIADAQESNIPVSQAMSDVLMHSDLGAEMLYELAKDHDLAARIARMSPLDAAKALGKIEARLENVKPPKQEEAQEENEDAPPPVAHTKAPAPPTPVRKPTSTAPTNPLDARDYKEFAKLRNAQLQRTK
jgi:hypothetical protein